MPDESLLSLLREPLTAIPYALTVRLRSEHPDRYLLESEDGLFDVPAFLAFHGADAAPVESPAAQLGAHFGPPPRQAMYERPDEARSVDGKTEYEVEVARHSLTWEGASLELVTLSWWQTFQRRRRRYLLAEDRASAEAFFEAVCAHNAEVRDEILVFANGCWSKSKRLYASVRQSSFDDVVLAEGLADRIRADFQHFLGARGDYARHRIPYKRGALFLGPPGNGKTLCIKSLIGELGLPALYIQSFVAPRLPVQHSITEVFRRARRTTPCLLILEDLDTLVDGQSLSFFLNELDGFADNDGLVTIASTNHPERLDPAILSRPSRFDRKYHFELPGTAERSLYIGRWNTELADSLKIDEARLPEIVSATDGYSFAYLKELFISSLMVWTANQERAFIEIVLEEAAALSTQMKTVQVLPETRPVYVPQMPDY